MRWTVAVLIFILAACRHQPQAYTLASQGRNQVLTPPPSKPEIKSARKHPARKTGCDIEEGSFALAWRGNTAHVTVKAETYFAPTETSRAQQADPTIGIAPVGQRIYVSSAAQLEDFREAMAKKEDAGCLRGEEGAHLRQAITERFAFPPQIAAYLRFGTYTRTGFMDLIPGFLLRLVSPAGSEPDVSFYTVTQAPGDDRVRVSLASGAGKALTVPETAAYYRYLYWTGASAHNFRATILGAPERQTLTEATGQFLSDPEGFCAKPSAGIFCQSIAVTVGMNVGFNVRINGRDAFVRMGGAVYEAVGENVAGLYVIGRSRPLPQIRSMRRMFHGKLIPIKFEGNDILSLVLMPGDEITY
jgi:hypothetical protein